MPAILARMGTAFRQPLRHEGLPIHADTRIGYVAINGIVGEPDGYLRQAQAAAYHASQSGHDLARYQAGIRTRARANLLMLGELTAGMERGEVVLHYQPKVSLRTGAVVGVEALVRWNHPVHGQVAPGVFVPRAEQSTLIHQLTEFVLERAMRQAAMWRDAGVCVPVAVNVSPRNFLQAGFCATVKRILARCNVDPDLLELELTEGALAGDVEAVAAQLRQLSDFGIRIAIDDFGTGYSSLTYLDRLPVSVLKIDQSFIRRLPAEPASVDLVDAMVSVAHKRRVELVAEGVENDAVCELLRTLGCDFAQGYGIARPMRAPDYLAWYRARVSAADLRDMPVRTACG
jgi:EAL domain-containing protein (putative c-di-GMP-specific phosphodiesterase class I)